MLSLKNKQLNSIFERIVKDHNGALIRVRFMIVEVNGKFTGQIISATPLASVTSTSAKPESKVGKVICLPCEKDNKILIENSVAPFESILSPYFSLEFFMSQPTRAPAFII